MLCQSLILKNIRYNFTFKTSNIFKRATLSLIVVFMATYLPSLDGQMSVACIGSLLAFVKQLLLRFFTCAYLKEEKQEGNNV